MTTDALAIRSPDALTARRRLRPPLTFTDAERQIIRDSYMPGATEPEVRAMIAVAEHMRLDPFKRQIHFVQRWNSDLNRMVWSFQTAIDGFRSIAEDTGEFLGSDEPEFTFEDRIDPATGEPTGKKELVARVRVYRRGFDRPFVGVARYSEFVQTKKDGTPNSMWLRAPRNQLAKCAEAQAHRKGFPQDLADVYSDDEMPERDVSTPAIVRGDVKPLATSAPTVVDAELVTAEDWPAAFAGAADAAALAVALGHYQARKDTLPKTTRELAKAAHAQRKRELADAAERAAVPEHVDPATGEVVPAAAREPGEDG